MTAAQYTGLKEKWISFARQLQSLARKQDGVARIEIVVIVDGDGNPLLWETPNLIRFSPCIDAGRTILEAITKSKNA